MDDCLRIALIAPIAEAVSHDATSSIEQLVWLLCEGLAQRGHDVTLFASGNSRTSAQLHATYPRTFREDPAMWKNWEFHETANCAAAFARDAGFDVIHSHAYHYALPFTGLVETPVVHTAHVIPDADVLASYASRRAHVATVSRYMRGKFGCILDVPIIYNGIDTAAFPFNPAAGDYLLFLGHLIEKKGPVLAVEVARRTGIRLVMAGRAGDYFDAEVAPLVDGNLVEYVGPVGLADRNELLAGAAALVFPSVWAEPFGLVLVEAMACGTPVAALDRCAVPEIVDRDVTGCYADDVDGLAAGIAGVVALDRATVQLQAAKRFDYRRMAEEYEGVYLRLRDGLPAESA